ncbi:sulfate ABC transporter substrate-binding protein [Heliorestis convoluta]|uniref:Sulfate ABC transporter, sulfate-binding protein CysP n=1 Tax=Heliorestis convoluta TaxID=356322 RepID=A0A5Q2N9E8_9FIRM|nr:sulfate ABC transporter substrate-binding protein [Heliorestis convoluta]QGG49125.1 sulfate ABC transporter, sulfate-binding protein CysP [Heliorestis convoluta]
MKEKNKSLIKKLIYCVIFFFTLALVATACSIESKNVNRKEKPNEVVLTLSAYSVVKEALEGEVIPAFQKYWLEEKGEQVTIRQSYGPSGAQARAIVGGLRADIAFLALENDMNLIAEKGLITEPWKERNYGGMVTHSLVAIGVRPGNPMGIQDWSDLTQEGIEVIYPSPRTSGGAMWIINAIYGSALIESETATGEPDSQKALQRLQAIQERVRVMDKSARESMTTFEQGLGHLIVTYENELLLRNREEKLYDIVYPKATIRIENPIAIIDKNVDRKGNREVAEAFLDYLWSEEAQQILATYGFRPVHEEVIKARKDQYVEPELLFSIDYLGGWDEVRKNLFGPHGAWTQIIESKGR